jgi:sec-independent protein translocase protein TatA
MFGLGMGEILIISALVILMFGSKKLPGLGKALGESITNFKKGLKEGETEEDKKEIDNKEDKK